MPRNNRDFGPLPVVIWLVSAYLVLALSLIGCRSASALLSPPTPHNIHGETP